MNILYVLLDGAAAGGQAPQGGFGGIWLIILLFVAMWLLMIRPQNKRAKEEAKMREALKKGDRVMCSGGIYGKVHAVNDTTIDVEISNGVVITVEKNFIQSVVNNNEEEKK